MSHCMPPTKKMIVLVADLDAESAIRGLLGRDKSLGISSLSEGIDFDILRHPQRDPGCRYDAVRFLRAFANSHRRALVIFDHHGCGQESESSEKIEREVEQRLASAGWQDRAAAIAIEPDLEAWVWSDSPSVAEALGWHAGYIRLMRWLKKERFVAWPQKPANPKEAVRKAMHEAGKPLSPRIFSKIGGNRRAQPMPVSRFQ